MLKVAAAAARAHPAEPVTRAPAKSADPRLPTAEGVAAAVAADRPAFDACVQESLRDEPGLAVAGLQIDLVMTVNPSGIVTSSEIDDAALQETALGRCLRSAVRGLAFPAFEGEPLQVRIPLKIAGE